MHVEVLQLVADVIVLLEQHLHGALVLPDVIGGHDTKRIQKVGVNVVGVGEELNAHNLHLPWTCKVYLIIIDSSRETSLPGICKLLEFVDVLTNFLKSWRNVVGSCKL